MDRLAALGASEPDSRGPWLYRVAGMSLVSEVVLPELSECPAAGRAWTFGIATHEGAWSSDPFHEITEPDGRVHLSLFRNGNRYLMRFPGRADFELAPAELRVSCLPVAGLSDQTIRDRNCSGP